MIKLCLVINIQTFIPSELYLIYTFVVTICLLIDHYISHSDLLSKLSNQPKSHCIIFNEKTQSIYRVIFFYQTTLIILKKYRFFL